MKKWALLAVLALIPILSGCEGWDRKKKYLAPPPPPLAPSELTVIAVSSGQIHLDWKDNSTDEKGFYVYRRSSSYTKTASLATDATSYNDFYVSPQTTYWYKVTAYNDGGESASSNEATVTTPADGAPPAVEILNYHMEEEDWGHDWQTNIIGDVRNNTDRAVDIVIGGKFFNYDDIVVRTDYDLLRDVGAGETRRFEMLYPGERIKRVEAWVAMIIRNGS